MEYIFSIRPTRTCYAISMEYVSWHAIFFKDIEIIFKYFWRELDKYKAVDVVV